MAAGLDWPEPERGAVFNDLGMLLEVAAAGLGAGALVRVGRAMNESHESLRLDYDVSTPELDALVRAARAVPGVYGSRLSGAGFGGCTLSLVAAEAVPVFLEQVPTEYRSATGRDAVMHVLRPSAGASNLDL